MMKSLTHQFAALAAIIALLSTAFAPLSSAQAKGEFDAFDPATVLRSPASQHGELLAFDMNRIVTQQTRLIRYQATEYQRKVAEERARAFVAAHRRAVAKARPPAKPRKAPKIAREEPKPTKETPKTSKAEPKPSKETPKTSKAAPKKAPQPPPEEPQTVAKPKELPRYIAVDTVKDKRASPKARKVVMIWDTHAESLVGNNIYDVQNPPSVGSTKTFETYSAEYIGAGL